MKTISQVEVTPRGIKLNGEEIHAADSTLNTIYREIIGDYPKFFKMDSLCKLGFIASELLLRDKSEEEKENGAIVLFNRNGSLITDRNYQQTITKGENYFPSPALFVYTLANIVTGEIAIRHKMYGESSFYILDREDENVMRKIAEGVYETSNPDFILTGWVDYVDDNEYKAKLKIITNK